LLLFSVQRPCMHHKMQNGKEAPTALNRFGYMAPNILLLIYGHENLRCIEIIWPQ